MINDALRCPSCDRLGFVDATDEEALTELVGAICHYCGHVLDRQGILDCLAQAKTDREQRTPGS